MVECLLAKEEVAGSSPVFRSKQIFAFSPPVQFPSPLRGEGQRVRVITRLVEFPGFPSGLIPGSSPVFRSISFSAHPELVEGSLRDPTKSGRGNLYLCLSTTIAFPLRQNPLHILHQPLYTNGRYGLLPTVLYQSKNRTRLEADLTCNN